MGATAVYMMYEILLVYEEIKHMLWNLFLNPQKRKRSDGHRLYKEPDTHDGKVNIMNSS